KTPTFTPIGAGPFTVQIFAPNEATVVKARPDYWGGAPNLDSLKFVGIVGDQAKSDSLKSGGIQMAFTRTPQVVATEQAAGYPGFLLTQALGQVYNINNRAGRPGANLQLRQAMAYATNVDTYNQRVYEGKGLPGTEIFPPWSQWHNDVGGLKYDAAKAKQLVDAAKKDGASTTINYIGLSDPPGQQSALTAQALLQAVGFTVNIQYQNSVADVVKKLYVDHDYDMAFSSYSLYNADPYTRLYSALNSKSTNNTIGYSNPDMDALLSKIQAAPDDQAKTAALADLQKLVNDTVPFVTLHATATFIPWQKNVHGVKPTLDGVILFDKVWMSS
ncbi:MAG: ABC transporter substrate-binding protein, partial [Mycobacteriaceae bacterium]